MKKLSSILYTAVLSEEVQFTALLYVDVETAENPDGLNWEVVAWRVLSVVNTTVEEADAYMVKMVFGNDELPVCMESTIQEFLAKAQKDAEDSVKEKG